MRVLVPEILVIASFIVTDLTAASEISSTKARNFYLAKKRGADPLRAAYMNSPCPLLRKGACLVYPVRPISCRQALSSNAQICRATYETPVGGPTVPLDRATGAIGVGALAGFAEALMRSGLEHGRRT